MPRPHLTEEWRDVVGLAGAYSVSSNGRIRRNARGPNAKVGKILTPVLGKRGYMRLTPCYGPIKRTRSVHDLVAEAFLGPRPMGCEVNHKNGVKTDNRAKNLEWVTHADNIRHAIENLGYEHGFRRRGT